MDVVITNVALTRDFEVVEYPDCLVDYSAECGCMTDVRQHRFEDPRQADLLAIVREKPVFAALISEK